MTHIKYLSFLILPFLICCSPVQQSSKLSQPTNIQLVAGIGDTILSIAKEKNLPNAFGAADIFGRKTPAGITTVQYLGIRKGKAIFKRSSVLIETGATTLNMSPTVIQNSQTTTTSGIIGGTIYSGMSTTTGPETVIPPNTPRAQFLNQGSVKILVDLKKSKKIIVEGKIINIESADDTQLVYSIAQ